MSSLAVSKTAQGTDELAYLSCGCVCIIQEIFGRVFQKLKAVWTEFSVLAIISLPIEVYNYFLVFGFIIDVFYTLYYYSGDSLSHKKMSLPFASVVSPLGLNVINYLLIKTKYTCTQRIPPWEY